MQGTIDVPVCADAKAFIQALLKRTGAIELKERRGWMNRCREWKVKYPVTLPEYRKEERVSTHVLTEVLSDELSEGDIAISGSSGAGIEIFLLTFRPKRGQRVFCTTALGAMGNGLPAAIGACLAGGGKRTVCVNGDGCLQLNIQELETLKRLRLPVKIFVLNNQGYSSMRTSQSRYFGRLTGADPTSGLTLPDICRVAEAYGLAFRRIAGQTRLRESVREVLDMPGPVICDVVCPADEPRAPSMMTMQRPDGSMVSKPLEDLWPFLDREEFLSNMIVPPLEE
jgi:acetolactate synthase-1/2/3 large subunit